MGHVYNPSTRCSRPTWATKNLSINKQAMELQGKSPRGCGSLERLLEKSRMLPSRCCHSPYRIPNNAHSFRKREMLTIYEMSGWKAEVVCTSSVMMVAIDLPISWYC